MKFKVKFSKEWTEYGEVEIEADNSDDAEEIAQTLLADGSEDIEWRSDSMDPGEQHIENISEV